MNDRFFLFILFFIFQFSYPQKSKQKEIDSLYSLITDKNAYVDKENNELLRLCTEVYYQSKEIGYEKGQLNAIVKMSEIYLNEGNIKEGVKEIPKGLALAEKLGHYASWTSLLLFEGINMVRLGYYQKANISFHKALTVANKIRDKDKKHHIKAGIYDQIADLMITTDKVQDSLEFYILKGYSEAQLISKDYPLQNTELVKSLLTVGSGYFYLNDINKAENYLDEAENMMKDIKDKRHLILCYRVKGEIENKKGNHSKSIEYFHRSIDLAKQYNSIYQLQRIYPEIAKSYREIQNYKQEAVYLEKTKKLTDSISYAEKKMLEKIPQSVEPKKQDLFTNRLFVYETLVVFLMIFTGVFIWRKKKQKQIIKENGPELLQDNTTFFDQTTEEIDPQKLNQVIELARINDESFYFKFLELFPKFGQNLLLINPQLTPSDLEYCALMKLNFDTKQIATYKKTSISSVESKKYRVRKKLNIASHENIYTWLMDL